MGLLLWISILPITWLVFVSDDSFIPYVILLYQLYPVALFTNMIGIGEGILNGGGHPAGPSGLGVVVMIVFYAVLFYFVGCVLSAFWHKNKSSSAIQQ